MSEGFDAKLNLLHSLSGADSLQEIVDFGYLFLGNPIFITDMTHSVLAYTKVAEIEDVDWQRNIVQGMLDLNDLWRDKEVKMVYANSAEDQLPVLADDNMMSHSRLIKTLISNGRPMGVVTLVGIYKPIISEDILLFELVSSFVLSCSQWERNLFSSNKKDMENFIIKLLDGVIFSGQQMQKRLNTFKRHHLSYLYVMVMWSEDSGERVISLNNILKRLSEIPYCQAFIYSSTIVFIYSRKTQISNWDEDEPELCGLFLEWHMLVGISRGFREPVHMRKYYKEACTALRLGEKLDRRHRLYLYNNFSVFHLLEALPPDVELHKFCHEKILTLQQYDELHKSELLKTLQIYLENARSMSKTADILLIHKNTVIYRIKKCMEIMQTDFENGNDIFSFILSLRIVEYIKKMA